MKNYRALEYSKTGFRFHDKFYYGLPAFCLYTFGFINFHIKRFFKA